MGLSSGQWASITETLSVPKITSRQIKRFRKEASVVQNDLCFYCEHPMWECDPVSFAQVKRIASSKIWRFQCTTEHLNARRDGGDNQRENIVAACRYCNQYRHNLPTAPGSEQFKLFVQGEVSAGRWFLEDGHDDNNEVFVRGRRKLNWLLADAQPFSVSSDCPSRPLERV